MRRFIKNVGRAGFLLKVPCPTLWILLLSLCINLTLAAETDEDASISTNNISTTLTNTPGDVTNAISEEQVIASKKEPAPTSSTPSTNKPAGQDLASFKIISERNIFNMNRSPRSTSKRPENAAPKPVKAETFSLVGTLSSDKGRFAFFDGSSSRFRQVLKEGDSIAGYKVAQIDNSGVKLEAKEKQVQLDMGMQMRRQGEGEWEPSGRKDTYVSANPSSATTSPDTSAGEESDVLKRLMQQREKELNK